MKKACLIFAIHIFFLFLIFALTNTSLLANSQIKVSNVGSTDNSNLPIVSPLWFLKTSTYRFRENKEKCKPLIYDGQQDIYLKKEEFKKLFGSREKYKTCYNLQKGLITAAQAGDLAKIEKMLNAGANVEGAYDQSFSALWAASTFGQNKAVLFLLSKGAELNRSWTFGNSPLVGAIKGNQIETVKLLLEKGANVCGNVKSGYTPLSIAVKNKRSEVIEVLKQFGGDKCNF